MTPFFTILTNYGKTVLAEALAAQQPLEIPYMAVGDSGGEYYEPTEAQTNLRNERWRGDLNDLRTDEEFQGQVIAEAIIPHGIEGDWTAREIGLFDVQGGLVAVGKYPETYIPSAISGATSQIYINIIIKVDNVAAVQLIVDHGQVLASKLYVAEAENKFREELSDEYGVSHIGGAVYRLSNVDNLRTIQFKPKDGDVGITACYSHVFDGGGATYSYCSSSNQLVDNFLIHNCVHGGQWMLIDNRSRLPFQVAGAKVNGIDDDREAFIATLKAKRPMSLSNGEMLISGHINLDDFNEKQWTGVDIEGVGLYSEIVFLDGAGGLSTTNGFIRCLTLSNVRIKNKAMDKTGVGFQCPRGAEQLLWDNVTFSGWKVGYDVHAWNSSFANVTSRDCEYAGCFSGTSLDIKSFYALRCTTGHCPGFRYNNLTGELDLSPQALSYITLGSMAADNCVTPYLFGFCQNVTFTSLGAEEYLGECILDFSRMPSSRARENIVINSFDFYVESRHVNLKSIIKEPNYSYGAYYAVMLKDSRCYSDRNIPFFDKAGTGFLKQNISYNRLLTSTETNGIKSYVPETIGEMNGFRPVLGMVLGEYPNARNIKAILPVPAGKKLILRLHEHAASGLGSGVFCVGDIGLYPAHISANNTNRDCGELKIAVSTDYADGFNLFNAQKIGILTNVSVSNRMKDGVYEFVVALNQPVLYMCKLDLWKNGNFKENFTEYYTE